MFDTLTNSSYSLSMGHGGKRPGAGRPANPESIRSEFEADKERPSTKREYGSVYQTWRSRFISEHAHRLVNILSFGFHDNTFPNKYFLSENQALRLSHYPQDVQLRFLPIWHEPVLRRFIEQFKDYPIDKEKASSETIQYALNECRKLLRIL